MKKKMQVLVVILGMIIISFKSYSQDPNFHIYLCFGQSNMEGMGTIESQDKTTNARVKVLQDQTCSNLKRTYGTWYTAVPPLNRCWSGLGPADYFGKTMADATPSHITIGLIPAAVSGCDIAFFQKGAPLGKASVNGGGNADIPTQFTGGYEWIIDMVKKAQKVGVIKGIIFHQGETNTGDANWKYKVQGIVNNLRTDLSIGNVPFLAGELLYKQYSSCCSSHNNEVNKIPSVISNSYVISASGLPGQDVAHFTSASYRTLGWRYAQQMLALENNACIPTAIVPYVQSDGINWVQASTAQICVGGTIKLGPQPSVNTGWTWKGPNNFTATTREIALSNITISQGGVYTVTYTNAGGCMSTSQITVAVNALPLIDFNAQIDGGTWNQVTNVNLCSGSNLILGPHPVAATGWSWTGPNGFVANTREINLALITASNAGTYSATYIDGNGCVGKANISVMVNALPTASITTTTTTTFCAGGSVQLTASTGNSYKWMNGTTQVGTGKTYTANSPGNYTVEVTNANNCKAVSASTMITVNPTPNTPTIKTPIIYCQNATAVQLSATGNNLKWYTTANGVAGTTIAPTPSTSSIGTTNYYVSQTTNGCESSRAMIAVTVVTKGTAIITANGPTTFCTGGSVLLTANSGNSYKWMRGTTQVGTNQTYTAATEGSYTVEVTNGGNCKATSTATVVSVNPLPIATITANGPTTIIEGGSVVLQAAKGNGLTYIWKRVMTQIGTSQSYTATTAGAYTVEVTNASNCKLTSTVINVVVNANQASVITIISPTANTKVTGAIDIAVSVTDEDGSITLVEFLDGNTVIGTSTIAPYTYIWDSPTAGDHSIIVRVTDSNGGITTSTPTLVTSGSITTDLFSSNTISAVVYPNPSNGMVFIDTDMDLSNAKFMLVNVLGREVAVSSVESGSGACIDVSNLTEGAYVMIIIQDNSILRKKITIIK